MIIFEKGNSRSGKKQRWSHKYPRARINHLGGDRQAHKEAGWFKHNWNDDNYSYFRGNLHKFLLANVGRPVDKVFSEFLGRCSKSLVSYNLKEKFYDYIEKKEEIDWTGGFYVTNGILNYKKRRKAPARKPWVSPPDREGYNRNNMPISLKQLCQKADDKGKVYLGKFYLSNYATSLQPVWLCKKEDFLNYYLFYYKTARIVGVGDYVRVMHYMNKDSYQSGYIDYWYRPKQKDVLNQAEYVFVTKA